MSLNLNLGCGADRRDGWVGVDLFEGPTVDVVHNLNVGPWPWATDSVDMILARHIFEHVDDPVLFMAECWRILRPAGALLIETPHWKSRDAFTDPTHKRFPTEHTFDYWIEGTFLREHHGQAYGKVAFDMQNLHIQSGTIFVSLFKTTPED